MNLAIQADPPRIPVLWMDDKPGSVKNYSDLLTAEDSRIAVEGAVSIEEARRKLSTGRFAGLIVDCKMDEWNTQENGAAFLLEVNKSEKCMPTFVFSAYIEDPLYSDLLARSYAILTCSRLTQFRNPISRNPFFARLSDEVTTYAGVKDLCPEQLRFDDYMRRPETFRSEVEAHWTKHRVWISKEMEIKGYSWCVVCGESLVAGTPDISDFPEEEGIAAIGWENNLIPFGYSKPELPEEFGAGRSMGFGVGWQRTAEAGDWYPSIRITINDAALVEDFDTGAFVTFVSDRVIPRSWSSFLQEITGVHLGKPCRFFPKKVAVTLTDARGHELTQKLTVHVVDSWSESSFVEKRRTRKALVGRDVLRAFDVEVILNSKDRVTEIRFLESSGTDSAGQTGVQTLK